MTRILTIAFVALALAGCVSTPYGTMRSGDWAYVQSLPAHQQEMAGYIYAEDFRRARARAFQSNSHDSNWGRHFAGIGAMSRVD